MTLSDSQNAMKALLTLQKRGSTDVLESLSVLRLQRHLSCLLFCTISVFVVLRENYVWPFVKPVFCVNVVTVSGTDIQRCHRKWDGHTTLSPSVGRTYNAVTVSGTDIQRCHRQWDGHTRTAHSKFMLCDVRIQSLQSGLPLMAYTGTKGIAVYNRPSGITRISLSRSFRNINDDVLRRILS